MKRSSRIHAVVCLLMLGLVAQLHGQTPEPASPPSTEAEANTEQAGVMTVDREAGVIDLNAKMVPQEPEWLELIATTPGEKGRGHEAIVTVDIKPSRLHLELVLLGQEPGHPLINRVVDGKLVSEPPVGPPVALFFVQEKDGHAVETPVNEWVVQKETGDPLPPGRWLFTGSKFREWQGREYYMADEAGNIASLVNFGDDLIVRQTETTQDTDFQELQINQEAIPPYGSDLILRIKLVKPDPPQPQISPESGPEPPSDTPGSDPVSDKADPAEP